MSLYVKYLHIRLGCRRAKQPYVPGILSHPYCLHSHCKWARETTFALNLAVLIEKALCTSWQCINYLHLLWIREIFGSYPESECVLWHLINKVITDREAILSRPCVIWVIEVQGGHSVILGSRTYSTCWKRAKNCHEAQSEKERCDSAVIFITKMRLITAFHI